jgi:hypothetical protein
VLLADGRRPDEGHRHPPRPPWGARVTTPLEIREFVFCAPSHALFLLLFLCVVPLCGAAARHASTPRQMMDNIVVVQTV